MSGAAENGKGMVGALINPDFGLDAVAAVAVGLDLRATPLERTMLSFQRSSRMQRMSSRVSMHEGRPSGGKHRLRFGK